MGIFLSCLKKIQTKNKRIGVITESIIPAITPILEFEGRIYRGCPSNVDANKILQIGKDIYVGSSGKLDDYINHSCNQNCYVHNVCFFHIVMIFPSWSCLVYETKC